MYDDVDEVTYQDMVSKRRADNFIEDDAGDGAYVDFGQEDWDEAEYSGDEGPSKRAKVLDRPHTHAVAPRTLSASCNQLTPRSRSWGIKKFEVSSTALHHAQRNKSLNVSRECFWVIVVVTSLEQSRRISSVSRMLLSCHTSSFLP